MREVILTVGTRAAGKTTFCKGVLALDPSIKMVSRDEILVELFGTTSLNPYLGQHQVGQKLLWAKVEKLLREDGDLTLILDLWNGSSPNRKWIIEELRSLDVDRVVAWYFVTPLEKVCEWFWKKPDSEGYPPDAPSWDHNLFHNLALGIDLDGFDEVVRVNPLEMSPEDMIRLRTGLKL